mmetsp:Transcript_59846/g.122111  ORF Transcript_59846/g.122111 Transcript_59846/m.122111 type:complete len:105 (+) Transcript_59846:26-340(+)
MFLNRLPAHTTSYTSKSCDTFEMVTKAPDEANGVMTHSSLKNDTDDGGNKCVKSPCQGIPRAPLCPSELSAYRIKGAQENWGMIGQAASNRVRACTTTGCPKKK